MMTTTSSANENSNVGLASTVTRDGKSVTYRNIADRDHVRFGRKHKGAVSHGQHALVEPGKRVVLWGLDRNNTAGLRPYRIEFKIGDTAEYDSWNLVYTGEIVAIGEKTITIKAHGRKHRLSIYLFNSKNHDFDLAAIQKRNSEWYD